MIDKFYNDINKIKGAKIYKDVNVKNDTNMKIDTLFSYKIEIYDLYKSKKIFEIIKEYKKRYCIIGNGSNILFYNDCNDVVLVKIMPSYSKYLEIVHGGDSLNYLNAKLINKGISSLNFLTGVPCSIGGAICMNAGAYGESMSAIIEYVYALDLDTQTYKVLSNKECEFEYRDSYFKRHNMLILGAKIKLIYKDKNELLAEHHAYLLSRREKMPLEYPNLGSVFKNPKGYYAGKLIEDLGLKGLILGGSMVSLKHANVIVNYDNATSKDIIKLMDIIKEEVYIRYKIELKPEIIVFK